MNKHKTNILIIGSTGFVGNALIKTLKGEHNIFLVTRDKKFKSHGHKVFYGDLINPIFCKKVIKSIDTVYYLAGHKKNISYHTKYPCDFVYGNVEPLMSFLKAAGDSNLKKIIYLSSTNVGFYQDGESDGYVVGKYINELILRSFSKQYDVDVKIIRCAPVYGPGDNFNPETANFIPAMIDRVFKSKKEVVVWGSGKRKLQFIFINDLILNIIKIGKSKGQFFVIGNDETLTINNIVKKIIKLFKKNERINNDEALPDKPTQLFKFNNLVNPRTDFDTGLKKTVDYYKSIIKI